MVKLGISMRHAARTNTGRYVSRLTSRTLAVVMAGGRGERLKALTQHRCKPATPFGGKFMIIDFVLSNCVNSGIRQIAVLTQYKSQSLAILYAYRPTTRKRRNIAFVGWIAA